MTLPACDLPQWWELSTEAVDAVRERTARTERILRANMAKAESDTAAANSLDNAGRISAAPDAVSAEPASRMLTEAEFEARCAELEKSLFLNGYSEDEIVIILRKVQTTLTLPGDVSRTTMNEFLKEDPQLAVPPGKLSSTDVLLVCNLFSTIMRQMRFNEAEIVELLGRVAERRRAPTHLSPTAINRFISEAYELDDAQEDPGQTLASDLGGPTSGEFRMILLSGFYRFTLRALGHDENKIDLVVAKINNTATSPRKLDIESIDRFLSGEAQNGIFELIPPSSEVTEPAASSANPEKKTLNYFIGNHAIGAGYSFVPRDLGKQPPIAYLMAVLLAKTFGTHERIEAVKNPAAATFVLGIPLDYQSIAYETLFEAEMLKDCIASNVRAGYGRQIMIDGQLGTLQADSNFSPRKQTVVCIHGGDLKDNDPATIEARRRGSINDLKIGLHNNTYYALLALVPDDSWLPDEITSPLYKDQTLRFAQIDRYVVAQTIYGAFGMPAQDTLHAIEQIDELRLRQMAISSVAYALNKATAEAAIQAIIALTKDHEKKVTMEDIEGMGEAQRYANMVLRDLDAWSNGNLPWKDAVRSLLLYGEPGTGKTYMAQAMANTLPGVTYVSGSFSKWQSADKGHLGTFLKAMREDFALAARSAPCVFFIDEIDSIGSRSEENSDGQNSSYKRWAINGFLECLNGPDLDGVVVVGACNDPDALDPAILRDGRMDLKAEVMLPGREAARKILEVSLPEGFPLDEIIEFAIGQTPAVINGAVRKAKSEARMEQVELTPDLVRKKLVPFPGRREEIAFRVAVHEAGHVVVANHFNPGSVKRAVIGQTGGGAAHLEYVPNEGLISDLKNRIAVMMAGRAAEMLVTKEVSAGAGGSPSSDIARATRLAISIEARLGLGDPGLIYWDGRDHEWLKDHNARATIKAHIEAGERTAREIIAQNAGLLDRIAHALKERRVLERKEIEEIYAEI